MTRIEQLRAVLGHQLIVEETDTTPTMTVDGGHLWVNTEFVEALSDEMFRAVLVHETEHLHWSRCSKP